VPFYDKYPRLPSDNYLGRRLTFVTICTAERRPAFTDLTTAQWALGELLYIAAQYSFSLHAYCLMPDHLHFIAEGTSDSCDLLKFVHAFKQRTGYDHRQRHRERLWQTRFYDHVLRSPDAIEDVACYIWRNPVRKGLCAEPSLYPLSGSQTMQWMNFRSPPTKWLPPWKTKIAGLKPDTYNSSESM
jgi:putative transposase